MRTKKTQPETALDPAVGAERSGGDRREPQRSSAPTASAPPDPEVLADRPRRRTFTAEYKKRILDQTDACSEPGQIGELLRREGLYSSHLVDWRRLRDAGALAGLQSSYRGRLSNLDFESDPAAHRVAGQGQLTVVERLQHLGEGVFLVTRAGRV